MYKNYEFEAKVFEEPSKYGIPMHRNEDGKWEGKVSKLYVVEDQDWVMNYDRGWDIRPNLMNKFTIVDKKRLNIVDLFDTIKATN